MKYDAYLVGLCNEAIGNVTYLSNHYIHSAVVYVKNYTYCKDISTKTVYKHLRYTMKLLKQLDGGTLR